jgi:hypothetical protein
MSQKTYLNAPVGLGAGMLADDGLTDKGSLKNTTGATIPFGVFVAQGATDLSCKRIDSVANNVIGVVIHSHNENSSYLQFPSTAVPFGETSGDVQAGVPDKSMVSVLKKGRIYVQCETACAIGGKVFVRAIAAGAEVLGAARNDTDSGDAFELKGARFASTLSAAGYALVEVGGSELGAASSEQGFIEAVVGAEGAIAANAIEIACTIRDRFGAVVPSAEVIVRSLSVTDNGGDIAAAGTPVGTLVKAVNPATGENVATFTATAGGLVSFRITNTVAEATHVVVYAENCAPRVIKLTFA